jgi:hypothetical protein
MEQTSLKSRKPPGILMTLSLVFISRIDSIIFLLSFNSRRIPAAKTHSMATNYDATQNRCRPRGNWHRIYTHRNVVDEEVE